MGNVRLTVKNAQAPLSEDECWDVDFSEQVVPEFLLLWVRIPRRCIRVADESATCAFRSTAAKRWSLDHREPPIKQEPI